MDLIQAAQDLDDFVVFGGSDVLANHQTKLGDGPPCHTRRLSRDDGRISLILSKKRLEVE